MVQGSGVRVNGDWMRGVIEGSGRRGETGRHLALEVRGPAVGEVDHRRVGAPGLDLRDHAVGVPAFITD